MLSAPFALDDLKKIVSGEMPGTDIEIDFVGSKIKNQALLTYLYNLNLSAVNINVGTASIQERRDLLLSYVNHKTVVEVPNLLGTYLNLLLYLKKIPVHQEDTDDLDEGCIFSKDEIENLMINDSELRDAIEHAAFILDGVVVHLMLSVNNLNLQADENFGQIGVLRDPNWIGNTWVNLFKNPVFNAYYYTVMPEMRQLVYFPYQYTESIYKGRTLLDYMTENPWVMALMQMSIQNLKGNQIHANTSV